MNLFAIEQMTTSKIIVTYLVSAIFLVAGYFFFSSEYTYAVKFQEIFYVYINILLLYHIKKYTGTFSHILVVFLFMLFFFGGIRIVSDLFSFGAEDLRESMFINYMISKKANVRALLNENLSIVCLGIGQFIYYKKKGRTNSIIVPVRYSPLPNYITFFLLIIGLAIKGYTSFKLLLNLITYGYHAMFSGEGGESIPVYLRALALLPIFVALSNVGKSKKWIWVFVIYLVLDLATGQRGMAALSAVTFAYVLIRQGIIHINAIKAGVASLLAVFVFIFMGNFRNDQATTAEDLVLNEFFWEQGVSINVLQCAVMEQEKLDYHFKDMFGNVYSTFAFLDKNYNQGGGSTLDQTLHYKVWSKYISYKMNSDRYYAGLGMGGNYIGQCYAVGKEWMVIIVNLMIPFFLMYLDRKVLYGSLVWSFFFFNILLTFLYIPRDCLFTFLTSCIEPLLVTIILLFLTSLFGRRIKNERVSSGMYCK